MNSKGTETNGKTNLSLEEKIDLIIEMLKEILSGKVQAADEPKSPPPTPPNP